MIQSNLFERLVTKISIKVNDLVRYLNVRKVMVYNYQNFDNFSDISNNKQYKIFYLFGKKNVVEPSGSLDGNCKKVLINLFARIDKVFSDKKKKVIQDIVAIEIRQEKLNLVIKFKKCESEDFFVVKQLEHISGINKTTTINKTFKKRSDINSLKTKSFSDKFSCCEVYSKCFLKKEEFIYVSTISRFVF